MIKVAFSTLGQTGLLPLWGRYQWHKNPRLDFHDPLAEQMVETIDYDFSLIEKKIGGYGVAAWGNRTYCLDRISRAHLQTPEACVVNLGVGLDDPFGRIYAGQGWVLDCDYPDVLDFREQFISADPARHVLRGSFLDLSWMELLRAKKVQVPLICLAGVSMYLKKSEIHALISRVYSLFPQAKLAFDALSPYGIQLLNKGMAQSLLPQEEVFWGLTGKKELQALVPAKAQIEIFSLFSQLPVGIADFKTQLQIQAAQILGISKMVLITG
jgi:O-methyltransferase involved in polyketide biosynthesis